MADAKNRPESELNTQDELEFIRGKIGSLSIRGEYADCVKLVEENLRLLYEKERWPDVFFSSLRAYQRGLGMIGKLDSLEERLVPLLKKDGIPFTFAYLLRLSDSSITWNPDYFKNLAMTSERGGDLESALAYSDIIIKLDPASSSAYVLRGWILDDLGRPVEAVEMYEQAIELHASNHSAMNSLAKHYAGSNPQIALEHINRAIELAPSEGRYYDTKAKILIRMDNRDGALACYDLAISSSPYEADYPYQKGELLLQADKKVAAIAQYRKALALNSGHLPTLWRLASIFEENQPEMALTYLNTIISLQPHNDDALLVKARLLGILGNEELAAEQYKELIDSDPKRHEALAGYANLLLLKDPASALEFYDKAIALAPDNSGYHMGKARALELLEMDAQAIKEYRKAISLDKTNARAYSRLATLLSASKPREAAELYKKASEFMPDNAFYYAARGELLMSMPNCAEEALECFLNASKHDPANAKLHLILGKLLEEKGCDASAAEHLKQAVTLDKTDPEAFYRLAKLILPTEPEVALLHINSAITLDGNNGDYYYFKSKILNELGHDRHALEQLLETLRADSKNSAALNEVSALLSDDSPKVSLMYINRAIELEPANQDYLCQRAALFSGMGQIDKAIAQYNDILKLNPKKHEAVLGIGKCLAPDPSALEYFDKAIALNNKLPEYYAEKAALLAEQGKTAAALAAYESALELDSGNIEYLLQKAKLLEAGDEADAACDIYKHVLASSPENLVALSRLGALLAETSPSEALGFLEHAIDLAPKEYLYHAWKGRALLALGDKTLAAAEYQTASRLGGETAETYFTLAELLQDKMPEIALGFSLRSLEEDDSHAEYHLLCGVIYQNLNQISSALDCFKKAISLDRDYHEPREKIAGIFFDKGDANALSAADFALEQNPVCAKCLLMRAKILNNLTDGRDVDYLIEQLDKILDIEPKSVPAREMLLELLAEKRSLVRLNVEKLKLNRIKKQGGKL